MDDLYVIPLLIIEDSSRIFARLQNYWATYLIRTFLLNLMKIVLFYCNIEKKLALVITTLNW